MRLLETCTLQARQIGRWLDHCPWQGMLVVGAVLGIGLGSLVLLGIGDWWGQGLYLLVLALAGVIGWYAQPTLMGALDPPEEKPEIQPPRWPLFKPSIVMVDLPAGTFLMGSPDSDALATDDEKPQHCVTVSAFAMSLFPVTRQLYQDILNQKKPDWQRHRNDKLFPANCISWFDAIDFCHALSEKENLQPCYRKAGDQVEWDRKADGYRLPTEAEWEYAARAGTDTPWFIGENSAELENYAWFSQPSRRINSVGKKRPHPWGFHDLIGNVWEWCWNGYNRKEYSEKPVSDPAGPATGSYRVMRGGSWQEKADKLRSAYRDHHNPKEGEIKFGFRCVRNLYRQ